MTPGRLGAFKDIQVEKQSFLGRIVFCGVLCLGLSILLVARLINLQVVQHDYYTTRADDNRMRLQPVPPVRGLIYDRHGTLLAQNQPAFVLQVTPEQVDDIDQTLKDLQPIIALTDKDIARFKDRLKKTPRYRGVPLRSNLTMEEVARYEINRYNFHGVDVTAGLTRNYPMGASSAHVVGYVGGITEEELATLPEKDYEGLTQIGKIGVEKSHEEQLRGTPGAKIIEANAYGRPLRELDYRLGAPGKNLYLSIDARVQTAAETALGDLTGSIVAVDPRNGEIIAMVSKPGFDPHLFVEGIDVPTYRALADDITRPLFDRTLQGQYPPGSTVKPAMAIAGLEYGVLDPSHREFCRGEYTLPGSSRKYRCWKRHGHGSLDMTEGIMKSCDVYFYSLANTLGIDRIHDAMSEFGLGKLTGVDLPLEKGGLVPSREWKRKRRKENWYAGETLSVGIGQGYMIATPLQLAQMAARIAMRGAGYKPHVVHAMEDAQDKTFTEVAPEPLPPIKLKNARNWDEVINAMEQVAQSPGGTAYKIGHDAPYRIAAKTGTAQVAGMAQNEDEAKDISKVPLQLRDHALIIAFAPADDPKIAVAVIAEHAGHGGTAAGPVARQVLDMALLGEVKFDPNAPARPAAAAPSAAPPAPVEEQEPDETPDSS
ncbi:MAG TPA: penicillin-binding protein 2, partial [Nevskiaceae bacterium]|nr:penicillin-binding protein 2 [Nevskiaceae bacterium]